MGMRDFFKRGVIKLLSFFYQRYKTWFWFVLFLAFGSGAVSKSFHSSLWEVLLNASLGLICLGVFIVFLFRKNSIASPTTTQNGRLVVTFTILGVVGGATILPYMIGTVGTQLTEQFSLPLYGIVIITILNVAFMSFIASTVGLILAEKVQLGVPILRRLLYSGRLSEVSKQWIIIAILGSFIGTFGIVMLETYIFQPHMPQLPSTPTLAWWKSLLTIFYGGIVEEVLLRLCLMTVLVWGMVKISKTQASIPAAIYWIAISMSSVLFGLAHLPATASLFGELTPILVLRAIIGNGMLGILFGYLYWKKGLEYSILSHMSADFFLHVIWASLV